MERNTFVLRKHNLRTVLRRASRLIRDLGGQHSFRNGEYFLPLVRLSMRTDGARRWRRLWRLSGEGKRRRERQIMKQACKQAATLGALVGLGLSADELMAFTGPASCPVSVLAGLGLVSTEAAALSIIWMELIFDLASLYEIDLDEDAALLAVVTILASALGLEIRQAVTKAMIQMFCRRIGALLISHLATQAVPVVGAGVGAAWNYVTTKGVGEAAVKMMATQLGHQQEAAA